MAPVFPFWFTNIHLTIDQGSWQYFGADLEKNDFLPHQWQFFAMKGINMEGLFQVIIKIFHALLSTSVY